MKYIVEVNAKYLVSIEATSALNAEHALLNGYKGIWGALAYDAKAMKTDTFAGAVHGCEMISMNELAEMCNEAKDKYQKAVDSLIDVKAAEDEIAKIEAMLAKAKEAKREAERAKAQAIADFQIAAEKIGDRDMTRNLDAKA